MDDVHESELTPVYHAVDVETSEAPRLFVLVQEGFYEDGAAVRVVVAYGIALPDGAAATVFARGHGFARWISPESASRRTHSDLVWV